MITKNFKKLKEEASKISTQRKLTKYASCGGVGCALLTSKGNIYTGVCIESCCGLGFCAEHSAVAEMLKNGESEIKEILSVKETRGNTVIPPCGRCREFILQIDLNNKKTLVHLSENKTKQLSKLLPDHWMRS
ncbi:MAG: cytidine deaminase [Candidatus Paceibacterota bacterium]